MKILKTRENKINVKIIIVFDVCLGHTCPCDSDDQMIMMCLFWSTEVMREASSTEEKVAEESLLYMNYIYPEIFKINQQTETWCHSGKFSFK